MSRRLLPTLVDYVVVAINPALIMGLIGSLVYFLIEVFYGGQYPDRLHFVLSSFVFASVLISRIAIESGFQHAAPFGMALAVVVGIALNTVGYFAWFINWGLMALIWWCAHKLTWDCTVIDESEEAAGRGLLETVGIDPAAGVSDEDATKPVVAKPAEAAVPPVEPSRGRWQDLLDPPDKPHTPGVWVVYFSLASLPIFGFGQALIPASRVAGRRYAFILLCVYVACGLALLLTTSFLSIRRYLRQRRLEMPLTMVGNWLSTGAVMIVVLLVLAALLPRPSPEFAISEVPWQAKSEQHEASKVSFGSEGVRDPGAAPDSGVDHSTDQPAGQESGGVDTHGPAGHAGTPSKPGQGQSSSGQQAQSSSGPQGESKSSSGGDKSSSQSTQNQQSQNQSSANQTAGQNQPQTQSQQQGQSQQGQPQQQGQQDQSQPQGQKTDQGGQSGGTPQPMKMPELPSAGPSLPPLSFFSILQTLLGPLKWVFYAAVICGVIYAIWAYREELLAIVGGWIEAFRQFWRALFSGRHFDEDAPELEQLHALRRVSFSDFTDPFARGLADHYGPAELVKHTFAALEAWGREQGTARQPDQTPAEFAAVLGGEIPELAADAQALASLYGRAVYSEGVLPAEYVANLALLWRYLQAHPPQPAEPAEPAAP